MRPTAAGADEVLDGPTDDRVAEVMQERASAAAAARDAVVEVEALATIAHPVGGFDVARGHRVRCDGQRAIGLVGVGVAELVGERPWWWPQGLPTSTRVVRP